MAQRGLMVGVLSCVLYAGLVVAQYAGSGAFQLATGLRMTLPAVRLALYTVGLNVFGFMAVAALSGYLAEGLRRADAQLQRRRTSWRTCRRSTSTSSTA